MDVSHLLVGGLTAAAVAWLVWAELHSRRNIAAENKHAAPESQLEK
jgi:hypothetical protein